MHHKHFKHLYMGAFFMVIKFFICFYVEVINMLVVVREDTHKGCIENFMALSTILGFCKIFYKVLPS